MSFDRTFVPERATYKFRESPRQAQWYIPSLRLTGLHEDVKSS